jgi:hypothetical protein
MKSTTPDLSTRARSRKMPLSRFFLARQERTEEKRQRASDAAIERCNEYIARRNSALSSQAQ